MKRAQNGMTQVPAAWAELPGSELVSSEDESWLNQSGFHLSDSSDDENSNLLSQAYVKAVLDLKVLSYTKLSQQLWFLN